MQVCYRCGNQLDYCTDYFCFKCFNHLYFCFTLTLKDIEDYINVSYMAPTWHAEHFELSHEMYTNKWIFQFTSGLSIIDAYSFIKLLIPNAKPLINIAEYILLFKHIKYQVFYNYYNVNYYPYYYERNLDYIEKIAERQFLCLSTTIERGWASWRRRKNQKFKK